MPVSSMPSAPSMRHSSNPGLSLCVALSLFLLSGCVTIYNPATQKKETLLIDTPGEVALGNDMDAQLRQKLKLVYGREEQSRLEYIGRRVAAFSDRQDLQYRYRIVKSGELNAFALPGGFIYVNSGLMAAASDDELACVLAHEIGHIAARHSIKRLQAAMGYQFLMGIVAGASGNDAISDALGIVFNLVNLGYSRQDEFLADALAVRYSRRAGFDPYGMVSFFRKLQAEAQRQGPDFRIVFLSSHPPVEERIRNVINEIATGQ